MSKTAMYELECRSFRPHNFLSFFFILIRLLTGQVRPETSMDQPDGLLDLSLDLMSQV